MKTEWNVQLADKTDADSVGQLYQRVHNSLKEGTNFPYWLEGVYPTVKDARKGWEDGTLYVVKKDGCIVGSVILNHIPEPGWKQVPWGTDIPHQSAYYVHTLAVDPSCAHEGMGRAIIQYAKEEGRRQGMAALRLDVFEGNAPALALYTSCGFTYIKTIEEVYRSEGTVRFKIYENIL